jgi:signal transduction histidine kinase
LAVKDSLRSGFTQRLGDAFVRFDDSLDTVLAADTATPFGAQSAWRQLTDLIGRGRVAPTLATIDRLRSIRGQVPSSVRAACARNVAFAAPPAGLVRLFADDDPAIAAPVLSVARLSDDEWLEMLSDLPTASRALLRQRRDLSPGVCRALIAFGSADFQLPQPELVAEPEMAEPIAQPVAPPAPAEPLADQPFVAIGSVAASVPVVAEALRRGDSRTETPANDQVEPKGPFPIADLVARIDAYQRDHGDLGAVRPQSQPLPDAPVDRFRFETDSSGVIRWVDGAPREPLVGLSLGIASIQVDGIVTGAFRRRASFDAARMVIGGTSPVAGQWQVSATPAFEPASGRFTGMRGVARRPRVDERAEPASRDIPPDSLRQLVHELRTPTNAISGFAEMIEAEVLGPAPEPYRNYASVIRSNVRDLINAIDDVDTAARIEQHALVLRPALLPVAALLMRTAEDLDALRDLRGSTIDIEDGAPGLTIAGDMLAVERVVARLMATAVAATQPGEHIVVRAVADGPDMVAVSIDRPRTFAGYSSEALVAMDSENVGEGQASLLGVGFTLRLARNLATELGGGLTIGEESLTLRLPAALDRPVEQQSSN